MSGAVPCQALPSAARIGYKGHKAGRIRSPGKTYAIRVHGEKFGNFKDADGRPAVPYLLVFKTRK